MFEEYEQWRSVDWIPEFLNLYEVSNFGEIRAAIRPKYNVRLEYIGMTDETKILKPFHSRRYLAVKFCLGNYERTLLVHRLVARAFIPIPDKYISQGMGYDDLEINHLNGDTENNSIWNLEWCTHQENIEHATRMHLLPPGPKGGNSVRARKVAMYDLQGNLLRVFPSIADVCYFFGTNNRSHICAVCRGTRYTSYCHIFRYVNDDEAVETKISVPELPKTSLDQINRKEYDTFRSAGQRLK